MVPLHKKELGEVAAADCCNGPLDISEMPKATVVRFYADMLLIRVAEEKIAEWATSGETKTPCHLGIGQEAVAVGVSTGLTPGDRVFGAHRSHSHYLALGGDIYKLLAEVLGKYDGASRGMGGSMHLTGREVGFGASVPIVGATIPIAVGAALAAKMDGKGAVAVSYFGDGAAEEGVLHESLNLAKVLALPVLFVCENNLFSSHLDIELRQPSDRVSRFADAHLIDSVVIDGNDVVKLATETSAIISRMREDGGPAFIEAVTYRHRGHVGPREDIDVGVRRSMDELRMWKKRDPILRLENTLLDTGFCTQEEVLEIKSSVSDKVISAAQKAVAADFPDAGQLMDIVYG